MWHDKINIVLVNPSHPGNIGATARAMKTMGLFHLTLVSPHDFPSAKATALAAGADDILARATITKSLHQALANTQIIFGTSARERALPLPMVTPQDAATIIHNHLANNSIAILFGRENNGLTNEELSLCNYHIHIPTNPQFSSLNIAAAVQIITYAINTTKPCANLPNTSYHELATFDDVQKLYQHLERVLLLSDFLRQEKQATIMAKLERLFNRAYLEKDEVSILRGILSACEHKMRKP